MLDGTTNFGFDYHKIFKESASKRLIIKTKWVWMGKGTKCNNLKISISFNYERQKLIKATHYFK